MVIHLEFKWNDGQYAGRDSNYFAEGYSGIAPATMAIQQRSDMAGYIIMYTYICIYIYIYIYIHAEPDFVRMMSNNSSQ